MDRASVESEVRHGMQLHQQGQLEDAGVLEAIGRSRLYPTVHAAVDAYTP